MARASSSSSCTEMVRSSLRRVLRLSHLEDMHGSDASVYVSSVGSLWILKVVVVAIGLRREHWQWPREVGLGCGWPAR